MLVASSLGYVSLGLTSISLRDPWAVIVVEKPLVLRRTARGSVRPAKYGRLTLLKHSLEEEEEEDGLGEDVEKVARSEEEERGGLEGVKVVQAGVRGWEGRRERFSWQGERGRW